MNAFDYGRYKEFIDDPRTQEALKILDAAAKKTKVDYAIIGGVASYLYHKNPPDDIPDIDILVYGNAADAERLFRDLKKRKSFEGRLEIVDDQAFAMMLYKRDIQIDILTSSDEKKARKTRRLHGVELEPVEPLIIEKFIRGNESDIRVALDLLAYVDYDKRLLNQLAQEHRLTGDVKHAEYFAMRMAAGKVSTATIDAVVKRLVQG